MEQVEGIPQLMSRISDYYKTPRNPKAAQLEPSLEADLTTFNPLPKILEIIQSKNPEKKQTQLEEDCELMDIAMQMIVDAYYNGFNKSIASYSHILSHITQSKQSVKELKEELQETKLKLQVRVEDLHQLWLKNLECVETLRILDDVEVVRKAPEQLESYVKAGDWQRASALLVRSLSILEREDIRNIGALYDVKLSVLEWNQRFHKQLTEELIDHIYRPKEDTTAFKRVLLPTITSKACFQLKSNVLSAKVKEEMRVLVDALMTVGRHRESRTALHASMGPELMATVASTISTIQARSSAKENVLSIDNRSSNSVLVAFLQALFYRCGWIISCHNYLCELFQNAKAQLQSSRRKKAGLSTSRHDDTDEDEEEYTITNVWESMQAKIVGLLRLYLLTPIETETPVPSVSFSPPYPLPSAKRKLFRFSDSSAATFSENAASAAQDAVSASVNLFHASPHNVAIVYPLVIAFQQEVIESILLSDASTEQQLQTFLDDFVQNHFLPHIQHDYQLRLAASVDGIDAFKTQDRRRYHGEYKPDFDARPLLQGAIEVAGYVEELIVWMAGMEKYAPHFMQAVEMIVLHFLSKCSAKYSELTSSTHTASLLSIPETVLALKADPHWIILTGSVQNLQHEAEEDTEDNGILNYENALLGPGAVHRTRLILDVNKLQMLANLCDSLEWLALTFTDLSKRLQTAKQCSTHGSEVLPPRDEKNSRLTGREEGISSLSRMELKKEVDNKLVSSLHTIIASISGDILVLGTRFRNLSSTCLLALKCELRLHCVHYLDSIRHCSYMLTEERAEPDLFVAEINKDLSAAKDMLAMNLPPQKVQYLFAGLDRLLGSLVINSLTKITEINRNGVLKMCRNLFAMQQNLSSIMAVKEVHFDRARKYYKLLNMPEEDLQMLLSEASVTLGFTRHECKVLGKHKHRASKKFRPTKPKEGDK